MKICLCPIIVFCLCELENLKCLYGCCEIGFQAYAVIAKGVRIVCTNTTGKNARSVVLKTQGNGSLKENIIMVFGTSTFSCLQPLALNISDSCMVEGFVSKPGYGSGRNIGDRQFFFVNGRPVDMPKVGKLVNELYRGANSRQYPIVIMNFSVPTVAYDVNVTPDKRKIFFSDETSILKSLRDALEKVYSSNEASYSVNRVDELNESDHGINVQFMHEGSQTPSKQLLPDRGMVPEEREDKLYTKSDGIPPTVTDNLRELSSEKMKQTSGGLPLRVHSNQKINLSVTPDKQITDRIDKHTYLPSTLTKKGSPCSEKLLGCSSTVQMSLNKFVTVNKRKHESVETALSEVPLLRSEPGAARLRLSSSLKRTPSPSSPGNVIDTDDSNNIDETRMIKISSTNSVYNESDDSILLPCGGRNRSVVRNDGDTSVLLACAEKKQNKASEVHNSPYSSVIKFYLVVISYKVTFSA